MRLRRRNLEFIRADGEWRSGVLSEEKRNSESTEEQGGAAGGGGVKGQMRTFMGGDIEKVEDDLSR